MTFAEYNTDANFENDKSSLEELVKIGKSEGMSKDSIRSALSPKWQKSSKLDKFDEYYGKETPKKETTAPKTFDINNTALNMSKNNVTPKPSAPVSNPPEETKPTEEKITEEVINETTAPEVKPEEDIKQKNKAANKQNEDSLTQEQIEYQNQRRNKEQLWNNTLDSMERQKDAFNNIDDHMVEQLPTFMFKRYQNGEFGDPKTSDAKLRLAHFMINGVGTALSNMSHVIRKDGQTEDSDYEKYQKTNMQQGLENRWQKYKEETAAAMDLAKKRGVADEELSEAIAKISSNNRLQASFNRMNEEQKVFTLQVMSEIGDEMGNMSDEKFANTLIGFATSGDSLDYKEAAAMLVYRYIKDPDKQQELLNKLGFGDMGGLFGGIGGAFGGGKKDKEDNPETTLEDGTNVDAGKIMTNADYDKIVKAAEDLGNKYYNGEINEEKFRNEYSKLEAEMKKHGVYNKFKNIQSQDAYLKQIRTNKQVELSEKIDNLNAKAKAGDIKPSEYEEQFKALKEQSAKWGASEKDLKSIEKGKIKSDTILKAAEKKSKKK
jgi:hypothetical protein